MLVPRSIVNERTHEPCRWCAGASLTTCHSGRPKAGPWCVTYFLGTPTRQSIARTCMPAGLWEIHEGAARQAPIETVAPRFAHSRACVIVFPISDTPFANTRSPWNACARYPITWVPTWPSACTTFTVMTNRVCSICSADQPKTADVADRERWLDPCQQWGPIRPHWHSKPFPHNAQSAAAKALGQRSERPQVSQSRFHAP